MKTILVAVMSLSSALALAQEGSAASEIDDAFENRMTQQSDKWFEDGLFPTLIHMLTVQQAWHPLDEDVTTDLGWMYKNIERPEMELLTYIKYAARNSKDRDHLYPEANFYFMAKSYVKVIDLLKGIDKQDPPPHPNAFRILAHSYSRVGLHQDALRIWDAYIKLAPKDLQAQNNRQKVADIIAGKAKPADTTPPDAAPNPTKGRKGVPPPRPTKGGGQ